MKGLLKVVLVLGFLVGLGCIGFAEEKEQGLVGYWSFDEGKGDVVKDLSGSGNDGKVFGAEFVDGVKGKALGLKGTKESYVDCGNGKSLNFDTGSFSYSSWVYPTESVGKWDMPIYKGGASKSVPGYDMELGTDGWTGCISDGTQVKMVGLGNETNNRWVYLVVVVDREQNKMFGYRDGSLVSSVDIKGFGSVSSGQPLWISRPGYPFKGLIDEVKVYNRALTADEIKKNFAGGRELLSYPCYPMKQEPLVDGKVKGDPAWDNIPYGTGFYRLGTDYPSLRQTKIKVGYREKTLFLGIECEEPEMKKIVPAGKDGGPLWGEDSIEVFLLPPGQKECLQFIVNTAGARTNINYKDGVEGKPYVLEGWKASVFKGDDWYSVEVAIPFNLLNFSPKDGDTGRFTVCRNTLTSPEERFTSWTQADTRFYEPEHFARIIFKGSPPEDLKQVQNIENEINRKYRSCLTREIWKLHNSLSAQMDKLPNLPKDIPMSKELYSIKESLGKVSSDKDYALSSTDALYSILSQLNSSKRRLEKMSLFFPGLYERRVINIESVEGLSAISNAKPGDVFVFAPGVYRCSNLKVPDGVEGYPVILCARGDGKVILENDGSANIIVPGSFNIFDGLEVRMGSDRPAGQGFFIDRKNNIVIQNCRTVNCQFGVCIVCSRNITIQNCEMSHSGHTGILCKGSGIGQGTRYNPDAKNMNIIVRNCYLHDAGWNSSPTGGFTTEGYGFNAQGAIENLLIEHCQIDNNSGDGILYEDWSKNTIARYNVIRGTGIAGIWIDNAEMSTFENNYLEGNNVAIWLSGEDSSNRFLTDYVSIRNNIIVHNDPDKIFDPVTGARPKYGKSTIIISSNTRNVYFDNNTIAFNNSPVLLSLQRRPLKNVYPQDNYRDNWFRNNIFWKNTGIIQEADVREKGHPKYRKELDPNEVHFTNNLWDTPYSGDTHPVTGDPLFVDPGSHTPEGYRLTDKSGAIDKAMVFDGACDNQIDAWNGPRPLHGFGVQDIGAHEYGTVGTGYIGLDLKTFPFPVPTVFKVQFNAGPEKW